MDTPADRTPDEVRLDLTTLIIFQRLLHVIDAAVNYAGQRHPDDADMETAFLNGALYGIGATYMTDHLPEGVDDHELRYAQLYAQLSHAFNEVVDWDMDIDAYAGALLEEVGIEPEEVPHA